MSPEDVNMKITFSGRPIFTMGTWIRLFARVFGAYVLAQSCCNNRKHTWNETPNEKSSKIAKPGKTFTQNVDYRLRYLTIGTVCRICCTYISYELSSADQMRTQNCPPYDVPRARCSSSVDWLTAGRSANEICLATRRNLPELHANFIISSAANLRLKPQFWRGNHHQL